MKVYKKLRLSPLDSMLDKRKYYPSKSQLKSVYETLIKERKSKNP
jgi:hypothetical protein